MPARVMSSRVPASGWQYGASKRGESSRVPARERSVAVTEQRDETERWVVGVDRRKDCEHACQNRQTGHSKGFWDDDEAVARPRCY